MGSTKSLQEGEILVGLNGNSKFHGEGGNCCGTSIIEKIWAGREDSI